MFVQFHVFAVLMLILRHYCFIMGHDTPKRGIEMEIEEKLKELILSRYRSMLEFTKAAGVPYGTVRSIFERGIMNSSVTTIMKICQFLRISTDDLVMGRIVHTDTTDDQEQPIELDRMIAYTRQNHEEYRHLTIDGERITDAEFSRIFDAVEIAIGMVRRDRENNT